MDTRQIETICYRDKDSAQDACIIVRTIGDDVALAISLESDGDVETILSEEVTIKLIEALQRAVKAT